MSEKFAAKFSRSTVSLCVYLFGDSESLVIHHRWVGVGHREDDRDATGERGRGAGSEVLLVSGTWFTGVHVHVDEAR